ncbi:26S proteasome non-ATPase regulatory subunit 6 [Boothiomyces macroporosus]|uniref:26S proteasome non-ATPase regulatory subunit 6 n=1 Tax=Boothiomyces macroporosus TaxID=261099 RepID=A0AAD5ULF6_9FUNG|nr:26S proteasome non-ATPase regulatory subunit 6 [Boothiomyces macroporosus]
MAPYYRAVWKLLGYQVDETLAKELEKKNKETLDEFEVKYKDAVENLGETDQSDILIAKASYLAKTGHKDEAVAAFEVAFEKTGPLGHRIDILFSLIRVGFFHSDNAIIQSGIDRVKSLIEKGGDWDRRNRLKVYEGIFLISNRHFKDAVDLLLDSLATFTSNELMEYRDFVRYASLTAALILDRPELKKVINSPEILECIHEIPHLSEYLNSFYQCQYSQFFTSLAAVEKSISQDLYLHEHYKYYVREMRIRVYTQLLQSYKSVTINSLATSFDVTESWIDSDLSNFIAAGRLNAVIDKVNGVVETNRPDAKNAQYQACIKEGDVLLNSIQKLSRVINV